MSRLDRLVRPRRIAVMGGAWAREVIRQTRRMGFSGDVHAVHPEKREVEGVPAVPRIEDLPAPPDAVFVGVARHAAVEAVGRLAAAGAGGAVVFASGFAETGDEGAELQRALVAAAGAMPVLGPNCYGFVNAFDGALLWPDLHGTKRIGRGVGLVTQSSNIAINLTMGRRALPVGYVLCLGNQAVVGFPDAIEGLAADPRVSAIGLHVEAIADPEGFARAVAVARAAGKPVVALRAGRSEAARAAALSHTASLAGGSQVAAAFLARIGVAEVETIPEFVEAVKALHVLGPTGPGGLVSMSCSGGEAALAGDAAARAGLALPAFDAADLARVRPTVDPLVTVANPFDYHTFDWGKPERLTATFAAVMGGRQAVTALVLDFPKAELGPAPGWDQALDAFVAAKAGTGARAAVVATLPEGLPEATAERLAAAGVVPFLGLAETMAALKAAETAARPVAPFVPLGPAAPRDPRLLDEAAAKALLGAAGVAVPEGRLVRTAEAAVAAVAALAPAAMKAVGTRIAHKTEIGGVRLNLREPAAAAAAFADLARISDTVLVERMVEGAVAELLVGVARDPALGLHLVLGAGGTLAELLADTAVLMLPTDAAEIDAALAGLRVDALLAGHRGRPAADRATVVAAIAAIARFAVAHVDRLGELDVNPLIVTPDRAVAADALLTLGDPP